MTMTSVAVVQGSLGAPSAMLSPNMYHSQHGLSPNSASPVPGKSYDTLGKGGKKSWSVRLGLSRQNQHLDDYGKGWGTISNGSVLSRQMIYGDPWLYGTVRLNRPGSEPRAFVPTPSGQQNVASSAVLPGTPVLVVCSCPEFLNGTARKLGNCRRCGGHRWVGVPLGGTCRLPPSSSRCRPSLAGMLRTSMDDPYDQMRRNRLVEPRSRARSTSPTRLSSQRDLWNQSVPRSSAKRDDQGPFIEGLSSGSDWYEKIEPSATTTAISMLTPAAVTSSTLITTTPSMSMMAPVCTTVTSTCATTTIITPGAAPVNCSVGSSDYWPESKSPCVNGRPQRSNAPKHERCLRTGFRKQSKDDGKKDKAGDTRKSILECDVNPYLLLRKRAKDEDDLSDELSDNALEQEEATSTFNLFDSSKVRSADKMPTRNSVAAISGQRVRVFNEPREEMSDDEELIPITRVPIPKVSPKRPPRRLKETAKRTLKSILKGGINEKVHQRELGRVKSVLFNVDNVIFAPEKPTDSTWLSWSMISNRITSYEKRKGQQPFSPNQSAPDNEKVELEKVKKIGKTESGPAHAKHKFITIPNIHNSRINKDMTKIPRSVEAKSLSDGIKAGKVVCSERTECRRNSANVRQTRSLDKSMSVANRVTHHLLTRKKLNEESQISVNSEKEYKPNDHSDLKIMVKDPHMSNLTVDEKDLILKSEDRARSSCLTRSRSDLSSYKKRAVSTDDVFFMDTMRISVCRRNRDASSLQLLQSSPSPFVDTPPITIDIEEESAECVANESKSSMDVAINTNDLFQRMRPTNWSPPPERQKQRHRVLKSMSDKTHLENSISAFKTEAHVEKSLRSSDDACHQRIESPTLSTLSRSSSSKQSFYDTKAGLSSETSDSNICKITVSPPASPLVHRLCIGPDARGAKRTSIIINGDPANQDEAILNNKVTISVGGEDSTCNPTVISINNSSPPRNPNLAENRTLVILGNYRSNIIVESRHDDDIEDNGIDNNNEIENSNGGVPMTRLKERELQSLHNLSWTDEGAGFHNREGSTVQRSQSRVFEPFGNTNLIDKQEHIEHIDDNAITCVERAQQLSKEAVISKLLEDSLKKAKENGEILDEGNGEAILKILKQSLLKGKEYSESMVECINGQGSSLNTDTSDLMSTNLFLEENPYEIIKEPIYEEIPDESPPPLPLSPPPSSDYFKDRMYFGEPDFYKLNSYTFTNNAYNKTMINDLVDPYNSKTSESFLNKISMPRNGESSSTKFKLFNFLMDAKEQPAALLAEDEDDEEDGDDADVDDDEDNEEEEDTERDLEALYEQKETSLGDLSSKSSQISNVSDSSEECNIILTSSPNTLKEKSADIERTDSGVGSESSQASSTRGVARRWRSGHISSGSGNIIGAIPQVISTDAKLCEDCEQRLEPLVTDSGVVYAPFVCRKCSKKRAERKEIITEIVETEQKYGRDLKIILEEFHRPMLRAGLLTSEQLLAIFLNVEELLEHNLVLAEKLKDAVEYAQKAGDEDLLTVDVGRIFLESERMLHAFENYCTRQGSASLLLQNLEKEKELLRIFLKVSQMENTVLRRMNLNSFLMVPVQRVTKYPLLLARLLKATPSIRADIQESKKRLKQAQTNIELHLEHMNAEAKDVTSTKLWRRISIIQNGRRSIGEQDMVNIKLRKMAVEVLEWAHEEARFVLEGRLLVAQPTDNNWRRGRTIKLVPVTAMLVANGKPSAEYRQFPEDSLFSRHVGVKEATLLLVKEKLGRCTLLREPLYLDKCIVYCETDLEDYFEIQELSSKETFIFKAEDGSRTKKWCRTLQVHAQSLGAWRKRRGALPNIMICGVTRN